ncbi:MAG: ABC transporter ATP-binding protein [Desulfovibrio sp.]|nr:ABC transporter ATP-binding protein [Desulfovibrio sp.]
MNSILPPHIAAHEPARPDPAHAESAQAQPLLELRQVSKVFDGQDASAHVTALSGFDLTLHAGEFLAVVGASGSGKSTLIDLVAGFTRPSAGEVLFQGRNVTGPGPDRVVVFQDHAVFPWYTAEGNVAYGLRRQGVRRKEARAQAREALAQVGLKDFVKSWPVALSGGMRQRVALARALVLHPSILLLDEPFASLDVMTRHMLQDQLIALWRESGWGVIFVTHMLDEAAYLADRIVVLNPPPRGLRGQEVVTIPRPRHRDDVALADIVATLENHMRRSDENIDKNVDANISGAQL